jgi:hypothetical protein
VKTTGSLLLILIVCFSPLVTTAAQPPAQKTRVVVNSLTLHNVQHLSAAGQRRVIHEVKAQNYETDSVDEISDEISERIRFALQKRG